ncbi:MAG: TIGR00341 family protein [Planctomycetota bacterium]
MRKLTVITPDAQQEEVARVLEQAEMEAVWSLPSVEERSVFQAVSQKDRVEPVLDSLEGRFGAIDGFFVLVEQVELCLPRKPEPEPEEQVAAEPPKEQTTRFGRVSRQELTANIEKALSNPFEFFAMVILASIVAAFGLLRDSPAAVIAAMVLAPLLGPNLALSLATTIGDQSLFNTAAKRALAGFTLALAIAVALGAMIAGSDALQAFELTSRTKASLFDFVLALASGVAGALSFLSGASGALIGVMVAVALLPPTLVVGIELGAGQFPAAGRASLLLAANLICVNFAGVLTFMAAGLRPQRWWEAERVKRATRRAAIRWGLLLVGFGAVVWVVASNE